MTLARRQIKPINLNFHLQKSLGSFHRNAADKIQSKKDKGIKMPTLMPIGVKTSLHMIVSFFEQVDNRKGP
jgi:hypothetical protein